MRRTDENGQAKWSFWRKRWTSRTSTMFLMTAYRHAAAAKCLFAALVAPSFTALRSDCLLALASAT